MPVCRQNLAVDQTALEYHGLQQESWWALGGPQPLIFTILAPSLAGKMGKGLSASPVRLTLIEPSHAPYLSWRMPFLSYHVSSFLSTVTNA